MQIVVHGEGRAYVAKLIDNNSVINMSGNHPRPGCAVREVMNWMLLNWGHAKEVTLELKEWK